MQIILTLLLTSTAFKFVYAERLPKVDYLTQLDHYMNCTLMLLLLQTVIHVFTFVAIDRLQKHPADLQRVEEAGLALLIGLWSSLHAWIAWQRKQHRYKRADSEVTASDYVMSPKDGVIRINDEWELASAFENGSDKSGFSRSSY